MRTLTSSIDIDAPPAVVWRVLTDQKAFADWNPFVTRFEGTLTEGSPLVVRIEAPGARPMTFRPTVTAVERGRVVEWLGRLGVRGLFDGRHRFELTEGRDGGTRLVQSETFTGLLVRPLGRMLPATLRGFEAMNEALKQRAERMAAAAAASSDA
jgi:hypothetical protein